MYGETFNNPKNPRDKKVTLMNKKIEKIESFQHKKTFPQFWLNTDDYINIFNG